MKKRSPLFILWLVLMLSLLLGGCSPAPEAAAPVEVTEEVTAEVAPVVEETEAPEPTPVPEADLDGAFKTFMAGLEGYNVIDAAALNEMMAEEPPLIIDVRQPEEMTADPAYLGHIDGAVIIPMRELAQNLDKLPDFDEPIVVYCKTGHRSLIAMTALSTLGWTNVTSLKGGFYGWVDGGNPAAEGEPPAPEVVGMPDVDPTLLAEVDAMLARIPESNGIITAEALAEQLAENPDLVVIDVRKADELAETGAIEGAVHIQLEELIDHQDLWPADLDTPIVVHCRTGVRAAIAEAILWTYGYTDVNNLKGGIFAWKDAGFATVGGLDNAFSASIENMEGYNFIDVATLNEMMAEEPPFILDVRTPEDLVVEEQKGFIDGAVQISLRELAQNLDQLPSFDTPIVVYCRSGWRSTIGTTVLSALGWTNVRSLKGGILAWKEAGYPVAEGTPAPSTASHTETVDPTLVAKMDAMLAAIPEGWGSITAENLTEQLAENPDIILVDVRTVDEIAETGTIEGALTIPLEELIASKAQWPADKEAAIVVYCKSGGRGTITMTILRTYGYNNVLNLVGGIDGWIAAGNPVVEIASN